MLLMKYIIFMFYFFPSFATEELFVNSRIKMNQINKNFEKKINSLDVTFMKGKSYYFKIKIDYIDRYFKVYVPKNVDLTKKVKVLFSFHGSTADMEKQSNDQLFQMISGAETNQAIVVFPNGYKPFHKYKFTTWNSGKCCGAARDLRLDDIKYVQTVFNFLNQKIQIDREKVYAVGISNGGMFTYKLACELSNIFTKVAAVSGTDNTDTCNNKYPVSILAIHALDDEYVKYNGGMGPKVEFKQSVTNFTSTQDTINKWKKLNKCKNSSILVYKNNNVECKKYKNCSLGRSVEICTLIKGGHSWPNSKNGLEATKYIWNFFNADE